MGKNKQTYTLQIDADIGNLESKLTSVRSLLSNVLNSSNMPKGLDKTFEKIAGIIDRVKAKAAQPIDSKAGFTSISKDIDSVQVALAGLLKIVQSINKLPEADKVNFLPPEAQQQIEQIVTSLDKYTTAVQAAITESEELATARAKLAAAEDKVAAAQAKVNQRQANLDQANADKKAAEDAIAIIDTQKKKLAELKEEQEKIEAFYSAADADGNKRNRSKKYAEVSMRPQDIKRKVAELEAASAGDEEALQSYRQALKTAKGDIESYVAQLGTANRALREAQGVQEDLSKTVSSLSQNFETSKPEKLQTAFSSLREEAKALGIELEDIGENYSEQDATKLINRIVELKTKGFDQLTHSVDKSTEEIEDFSDELKDVKTKVEDGTDALEEMTEVAAQQRAFEDRIKAFLGVAGAAQVLRAAVRDAMATITELDATMTEMAVVTDLTVGDYWDQLPKYSQRASELGVSINSAYKAATLYYQQGLKTNEVNAISAETLKMAKIANLDAADATDKMTAALRGFNMELNEESAQRVSDVYSELAAITAADTKEIANAMTKTASIASSAGMEFETTAAFLSQIIETTRESAETAGTAMKTVIARFQELKKAPSEIGEVDGEVVDANAIETALRSVGVSLRDSAGQFRELDDVFLELSSKWDSLDKNTQRYIATIAAGSRQQSRFIAMMSDYGRTQELVTAANNSAGASNKQFEKTMDSLEAKMEKLRNAWHEFTMGIMNSELVKFGVDALTKFLEIVNKATSGLNGLGGSITKILSILTIFKLGKTIFEKLKAPMIGFFADIVREAGLTGERAGKAAQEGLERSKQGKSGEPTKTGNFFAFGWDKVKEVQDKKQNARDRLTELGSREDIEARLQGSNKKLGLAKGRVTQANERLGQGEILKEEAQKKLAELEVAGVSKESEEWKNASAALDKANKKVKQHNEDLKKQKQHVADIEAEQDKMNGELKEYDENVERLKGSNQKEWEAIGQAVQQTGAAITGVGVATSMLGGVFSALGLEEIGEGFSTAGNIITMVGGAVSTLGAIVPGVTSILSGCGITLQASFWPVLVIGLALVALVGTIAILIASFKALKAATPEGKLDAAKEKAEGLNEAAQQAADAFNELNDSVETLGDKYKEIDDMVQGTKAWKDAVRDVNKQVMELIDQYPELARFVENTDGVLRIDFEKKAVQEVLDKYESRMMTTQAAAQLGEGQVSAAETDVVYSKIKNKELNATKEDKWKAFGNAVVSAIPGLSVGSSGKIEWNWADLMISSLLPLATIADAVSSYDKTLEADTRDLNEKIAQAMNDGVVDSYSSLVKFLNDPDNGLTQYADMAGEIWDNQESFKAYRDALAEETAQRKAVTAAMLASAQGVADMTGFTAEDNKIMAGLEDALDINLDKIEEKLGETKWHKTDKLSSEQYSQLSSAVQAQYGENAKIEGNKIKYYDSDNNLQTVAIKDVSDRLITQMASDKAINDTKTAIEGIPELRKQFANDSKMMALLQGEGTLNQLNSIDLSNFTEAQTEALKNVYGDNYQQILEDKLKNELDGFKTAERKLKGIKISETFGDVSAEAANALADIATNAGWGGANNFVKAFQQAQGSFATTSDKNQFAALMGSMEGKETLREAWEDLETKLKEQNLWNEEVAKFIATSMEKTGATYSQTYLAAMGVSDELYSRYQQAVISGNEEVVDNFHKTFKKWKQDYDVANDEGQKAEHELKTAISEALTKSAEEEIDKLQALTDAVNEANERMVQAIQKQIDEQRQARDNAKEEEDLNDMRNRVAYLRASGASPLELMQAEEELAAAEEGYSDKLVDQSIAKLEDANEKAASQREEQINLLRSQLDFWKETQGFKDEVDRIFEESRAVIEGGGSIQDTELWKLLGYDELSEYEQSVKAMELDEQIGKTIRTPTEKPLASKGAVNTTVAATAAGGAMSSRAEHIRYNKDLSALTHQVIKEEGYSGLEIIKEESTPEPEPELTYEEKRQNFIKDNIKKTNAKAGKNWNWDDLNVENEMGQLDIGGTTVRGILADAKRVDRYVGEYASKAGIGKGEVFYLPKSDGFAIPEGYYLLDGQNGDKAALLSGPPAHLNKIKKYKSGGLADSTGPAWLDGTKSRPEYVLNSAQTERFFSLVDVLERFNTDSPKASTGGGNHFEIEINVDKLENDYDVEQLADKIRRMLYDDATYRNVNAVGFIR